MADIRHTAQDTEQRLLLEATLRAFEQTTGIGAEVVGHDLKQPHSRRADAEIRFDPPMPAYQAVIKRTISKAILGPVMAQLQTLPTPCLLVAHHVNPPLADQLREQGIQFLDTAGNTYLHQDKPFCHIFVTGRKPTAPAPAEQPIRAFRATGLRVLFPLLCLPGAINAPYRDIADRAGVALGSVAQTMADLKRLGLLRDARGGRAWRDHRRCLDAWVDAYPRELRPRLKPRRFRVNDPGWWEKTDLASLDMWLGGEAGGALLTQYLRPELITVYGTDHWAELARDLHAVKDTHGNLEVLDPFWHFEPLPVNERYRLVPPLLIYADLIASADARNIETAHLMRERYLAA